MSTDYRSVCRVLSGGCKWCKWCKCTKSIGGANFWWPIYDLPDAHNLRQSQNLAMLSTFSAFSAGFAGPALRAQAPAASQVQMAAIDDLKALAKEQVCCSQRNCR